jgi:hypothetical protein
MHGCKATVRDWGADSIMFGGRGDVPPVHPPPPPNGPGVTCISHKAGSEQCQHVVTRLIMSP